jgi:DNA helicase-2/ATP-dependent DNA helicase PcrA
LDTIDHRPEFRSYYSQYEERLRRIGNVDFGDLIGKPVEILRKHPEVKQRFQQRFKVIMVDEYQDSNVAQFALLNELVGPGTYLSVVGDDDQSIYRFRGAEVRNILEFPNRFPGTEIIRLERNYRSTEPILKVAASVVDHNKGRLGKELRSERGPGKTPTLAFLPDQDAEAVFCAELIERSCAPSSQKRSAAHFSDWAILYRTNAQSMGFETEFLRRRIPYRVVGSLKFYEREEVKDILALLSFSVNPRDEVAFRRVVNKPTRGVGAATVDKIVAESVSRCSGNLAAGAAGLLSSLSAKARSGLSRFLDVVNESRLLPDASIPDPGENESPAGNPAGMLPPAGKEAEKGVKSPKVPKARKGGSLIAGEGLSSCVVRLAVDSGLMEYHAAQDEVAGTQRIANLQELANAASLYPSTLTGLAEFLEHIELDRSMVQGEDAVDGVTLITVHNTKGLEFPMVVLTGLEQGIFPRDDKKDEDLEEERRLFYVGATRAKDELYLTSCAVRRMYGRTMPTQPSLFLREISSDALRTIGKAPYGFVASGVVDGGGRSAAPAPRASAVSSDGRWQVGGRLFHDDYGYGAVVSIRESDDGPVILARFETGRDVTFLSAYQSARFMKVGDHE